MMDEAGNNALREQFIVPMLTAIGNEVGASIKVKLRVATEEGVQDLIAETEHIGSRAATGEIRVTARRISPQRWRFALEALFPDLAGQTGYSGFAAKGIVDEEVTPVVVRVLGRTHRYNVWTWGKHFRF